LSRLRATTKAAQEQIDPGSARRFAVHIDDKAVGIGGSRFCIPATLGGELEHGSMGKTIIDLCAGSAVYIRGTG